MNTILRPVRSYPIVFFTILACLFGWVYFIAYAFGADIIPDGMPLGPIIATVIVSALFPAALNTFGGKFFFKLVEGTDEAHLTVLMTVG